MDKTIFNRAHFIYSVFAIFLVVALAPILCYQYFPTVDGPAHLYNAKIIRELWWGDKEMYGTFFKFNDEPVPNWTGHLFAAIAGIVFPAWLVEKLSVLFIVIGSLTGINLLSRSFGAEPSWRIFLVLPFIYTITLYLGFFNFMFSLVIFLFVLSWMVDWQNNQSGRYFIRVFIATTLLYFSHILAFGIAIIFVALMILWEKMHDRKALIFSAKNVLKVICFVPGTVLAILFFSSRNVEGFRHKTEKVPFIELVKFLKEGASFVGLNGAEEVPYTSLYIRGIAVLIGIAIFIRLRSKIFISKYDMLLVFSILMLICYFVVPDGMASGGFISVRLLLLTMLFTVSWLLTVKMPLWISILAGVMSVYVSFSTLPYRMQVASQLNNDAKNLVDMASSVEPGSVVLPFSYSANWLHLNLVSYMGASSDLILIENYEADFDEFPLQWKNGFKPGPVAATFKLNRFPLEAIDKYEAASGVKVNYIARWLYNPYSSDSITVSCDNNLRTRYTRIKRVGQGDILFQ